MEDGLTGIDARLQALSQAPSPEITRIYDAWVVHRSEQPDGTVRAAAEALGVSERALLSAQSAYGAATALDLDLATDPVLAVRALLGEMAACGGVEMVLPTGDAALAVTGRLDPSEETRQGEVSVGLVDADGAAQLTLTADAIGAAFLTDADAVGRDADRLSLCDRDGAVVVEFGATEATDLARFRRIADLFDADQAWDTRPPPVAEAAQATKPASDDLSEVGRRWLSTGDQSEIDALLAENDAPRSRVYAALPPDLASEVDAGAAERLLRGAAQTETPMALRVANGAATLTYWGFVRRVAWADDGIRIDDPMVALRLPEAGVRDVWVVRAPTRQGVLTWLDLVTPDGASLCQMFGRRPDGRSLCTQGPGCWRALIADFVFQDGVAQPVRIERPTLPA